MMSKAAEAPTKMPTRTVKLKKNRKIVINIANSLDDLTMEFFTSKWVKILEYSIQFSAYALNKASICSIKSKWNLQL